jgi:hypothetical protein
MLRVRTSADHVSQRPQLLDTTLLGGADDCVKRVRVRMSVAEYRYDHHPNLRRDRAEAAEREMPGLSPVSAGRTRPEN